MQYAKISEWEEAFFRSGNAHGTLFHVSPLTITIPSSQETIVLEQIRRRDGRSGYFRQETVPKKRVFLHYTMGYLPGDVATLTVPDRELSVAFIVSRSGRIVQLFQSAFWSYHLGRAAVGGNKFMSSTSVGIEISNIGPLVKQGDTMMTTYSSPYCLASQSEAYVEIARAYRGYKFYATFPEAQIEATGRLLRLLTSKYAIPREFLPEPKRYARLVAHEATSFRGVLSHVNVRADKTDIGPAFPWDQLIRQLR